MAAFRLFNGHCEIMGRVSCDYEKAKGSSIGSEFSFIDDKDRDKFFGHLCHCLKIRVVKLDRGKMIV